MLGVWQDSALVGQDAYHQAIPIRYASVKGEMPKRIKHEAALMLVRLFSYGTWDAILQRLSDVSQGEEVAKIYPRPEVGRR